MLRGLSIAFAILSALTPLVSAQEAGVAGTITDTSGAVVPNAGITVKNVETGVERRATADDRGRYSISPLAVGRYTLSVEAAGFRTSNVTDILLTIGQTS